MPNTGWVSPGTVTGVSWSASDAGTLLNAVTSDDNVWAVTASGNANYLKCSNFGISLPAGAVLEGVEVECSAAATAPTIPTQTVTIGAILSTDNVNPTSGEKTGDVVTYPPDEVVTLGGPTEQWGMTLVKSDVEALAFAVWVNKGSDATDSAGRQFDRVRVKIYYSEPSAGGALMSGMGQMTYDPGIGVTPLRGAVSKER